MSGTGMQLSEEEQTLKESFNMVDRDGNGYITVSELGKTMRAAGFNPTDPELMAFNTELDTNKSGRIEFDEYRVFMAGYKKNHKNTKTEIKNAFKVLDANHDGYICAAELKTLLKNLGQNLPDSDIDEMIAVADVDSDGRIDYEEFAEFLCKPLK